MEVLVRRPDGKQLAKDSSISFRPSIEGFEPEEVKLTRNGFGELSFLLP